VHSIVKNKVRLLRIAYWTGALLDEVAILMIWYRERWLSPSLQAFMDLAKDEMKETFSSE
jgi:hypothetical protein